MQMIDRYRLWFEHEKDSNTKMLQMLGTVPAAGRTDARYERGLVLAGHIAACRENWLDRLLTGGETQTDWWPLSSTIPKLRLRFKSMELKWTEYLASLREDQIEKDFDFWTSSHEGYRWNVEGQIVQLVGHAFYHRGQIALIVEALGGKPVDTDFLYWQFGQQPERWKQLKR